VIAGHVDSAQQGKGAFFRLRQLEPGDPITVTGGDGVQRAFKVVGVEEFQKAKIPLERYFARDGAPRLTLITCGGPFDAKTRHYRDNIVVTAEPAS
jgi:sortase (surface protein transpeptidase)